MSGVAVILAQLLADAPLLAVVPANRIDAGEIPIGTQAPAISVMQVSSVPRETVRMGEPEFNTDRVQVTVIAKKYPQLRQVLRLVRQACPHTRGTVGGVHVDAILVGAEGPDFIDEETKFVGGSRDFTIRWTSS